MGNSSSAATKTGLNSIRPLSLLNLLGEEDVEEEEGEEEEEVIIVKRQPEEIIVKCTLEEMVRNFFKDYMIIWHEPDLNNKENQVSLNQLKKFCEVSTFTEWEEASNFIKETKGICHVITSGTNGESLV